MSLLGWLGLLVWLGQAWTPPSPVLGDAKLGVLRPGQLPLAVL